MARKKKVTVKEKLKLQSLKSSSLITVSYIDDKKVVHSINLKPFEVVEVDPKYKTQFIKFINHGLIKIL